MSATVEATMTEEETPRPKGGRPAIGSHRWPSGKSRQDPVKLRPDVLAALDALAARLADTRAGQIRRAVAMLLADPPSAEQVREFEPRRPYGAGLVQVAIGFADGQLADLDALAAALDVARFTLLRYAVARLLEADPPTGR